MVGALLSKEDCARCKFCCSFRRQSLWETPAFAEESLPEIKKICPDARFETLFGNMAKMNLDGLYQTDDAEEEVFCFFNKNGCVLPERLKPFECKIWPLRVMKKEKKIFVARALSCPTLLKQDIENIFNVAEGLAKTMRTYVNLYPGIIKEYHEGYENMFELKQ